MSKLTQKISIFTSTLLLSTTLLSYSCNNSIVEDIYTSTNSNKLNTENCVNNEYYNVKASIENIQSLPDIKTNVSKTGVVSSNSNLNVRKTASTKSSIVEKLKKGTTVTILDSKSGWYKIKSSNGKTGWVSSKYIKVTTTKKTSTSSSKANTSNSKVSTSTSNKNTTSSVTTTSKNNTSTNSSKVNISNTNNTNNTSSKVVISTSNKNTTSSTSANTTISSENSTSNTINSSLTTLNNSEKDTLINKLITTEGNVSSTEKTKLKEILNKLPLNLLKAVNDNGLKVLLTTKDVKSYYAYSFSGTMTGLFDPMAGKIYISSNVNHITKSTVHEFGHALDLLIGKTNYISLSTEWNSIYKAELNTASGSYYKSNAQEYFADAFNRYIENPSSLKAKSPKTYAYINSAIKNL